jgi:hypothetical protein
MISKIRQFNEEGIEKFSIYLNQMKSNEINTIPFGFISDKKYSVELNDSPQIDSLIFESKKDMVQYLYPKIKILKISHLFHRSSLWSWLAAFYLDSICPQKPDGSRTPGALNRYILDPYSWNRYYRHLIATPIRLFHEINDKDLSRFYLYSVPFIHGDAFEQLAARQEIATVHGVLEAAYQLYWDDENEKPKVNATDKYKPGTLRRFTGSILPQFQLTYDINSMNGSEIVNLLPEEFDKWKMNQV